MKECDEGLKAFDALYGFLSPNNETKPNEGSGDSVEDPDCTIDDAQKAQSQTKHGDEVYYEPFTPKPPRGSVEDIQHRLRRTGLRLRRELNHSLLTNPDQWTALRMSSFTTKAQKPFINGWNQHPAQRLRPKHFMVEMI